MQAYLFLNSSAIRTKSQKRTSRKIRWWNERTQTSTSFKNRFERTSDAATIWFSFCKGNTLSHLQFQLTVNLHVVILNCFDWEQFYTFLIP